METTILFIMINIAIVSHGQPMKDTDDTHIHVYLPPENNQVQGTFPENADAFNIVLPGSPMHYWLMLIKSGPFRFWNFVSHFMGNVTFTFSLIEFCLNLQSKNWET